MRFDIYRWLEEYLFYKKTIPQKILSVILYPLSLVYGILALTKRVFSKQIQFDVPIISIGNLSLGGSGKTPLCISIARALDKKVCIILRGYKRKSKDLLQVSYEGKILCSCEQSGDEAMLMAQRMPFANVIVCSNRVQAIKVALKQNIEYVILDDGFSQSHIKKFDILVQGKEEYLLNKNTIPSGSYREFAFTKKYASFISVENEHFFRKVHMPKIPNNQKTTLITSISKPQRLDKDLPNNISKHYFPDHYNFSIDEILDITKKYNTKTILMTKKDFVKLEELDMTKLKHIKIEIIYLQVKISDEFLNILKKYINGN